MTSINKKIITALSPEAIEKLEQYGQKYIDEGGTTGRLYKEVAEYLIKAIKTGEYEFEDLSNFESYDIMAIISEVDYL